MEGGTNGATATTTNSESSALSAGGGAISFSTARGKNGLGLNYVASTAGQCSTRWAANAASTTMSLRAWFWGPAATPAVTIGLANFHSAPGAVAARVQWTAANALILVPVTGSSLTIATGLTPGNQFDLSVQLVVGTTGFISGTLRSTSGTQLGTVSSSSFNSNTSAINEVATGILGTYATSYSTGWDEISIDDGQTSEIPLYTLPAGSGGLTDLVWTGAAWQ